MIDLTPNLTRFNSELTKLQQILTSWHEDLSIRETQLLKEKESIKRQREELITKSNLIVEQVNGLRGQKDQSDQKMLEAEKLKKSAITQLEEAETLISQARSKEAEIELREKNSKLLDEREKKFKEEKEQFEINKAELLKAQTLLKREQELSDEKQKVLVIRERNLIIDEAKQKRIMGDL